MKVCKFGGSSLADAAQVAKVVDIVLSDSSRRIVVVSAPGKRHSDDSKVTDLLIGLAQTTIAGRNAEPLLAEIVGRYAEIAAGLNLGDVIVRMIEQDLRKRIGQRSSLSPEEFTDLMKAAGEDNAARLVAEAFVARGKRARYAGPKETGLVMEGPFGNATLANESYGKLARAFADFDGIVIYPGFFGYRRDGKVATFPRGGSDITGSILAAAVRADVYENFTDVDSVYPCDPRVVPEVRDGEGITTITYREMRELAYAGFGVFNDDAVIPAVKARIPINVRNTNRPSAPGTMIQPTRRVVPGTVVGVAAADGICSIFVRKYLMNREIGFGRRLLQILEDEGIPYEYIPSGVDSICVVVRESYLTKERERRIIAKIGREFGPDDVHVDHGLATLFIVGEGIYQTPGMVARASDALTDAGITTYMANGGATEVSFMLAIRSEDCQKAVRALYEEFFGRKERIEK